ncbi:hypothetical protein, partial [Salmonella sp. M205]|uniref:hypothetical protein n=1 Tax=Salmonella sp. M205 TaxID=3240294 RepID=UPI00352A7596
VLPEAVNKALQRSGVAVVHKDVGQKANVVVDDVSLIQQKVAEHRFQHEQLSVSVVNVMPESEADASPSDDMVSGLNLSPRAP